MYRTPNDFRHDDADVRDGVRDAIRFSVGVAVAAVVFLVVAAVWGQYVRRVDGRHRGLLGGLRAFVRTYQAWRQDGAWWPWQGAGWFLLTAMLLVLTTSLPAIAAL